MTLLLRPYFDPGDRRATVTAGRHSFPTLYSPWALPLHTLFELQVEDDGDDTDGGDLQDTS